MKKVLLILLSFCTTVSFGQSSLTDKQTRKLSYYDLYKKELYGEAIKVLEQLPEQDASEEIVFYLSAAKFQDVNNPEIKKWIHQHPDHPLNGEASFHYATQAFNAGDSAEWSRYLSKVKASQLRKVDQASYHFMNGLLLTQNRRFKQAKRAFAAAHANAYGNKSELTYYQAYISYQLAEFDDAITGFKALTSHKYFGVPANYYAAKINMERSNYDEVIRLAENDLSAAVSKTNAGFYQLLGEAFAKKGNLAKADTYFEKAIQAYPGRPSSALYYQAGVAKFKTGNEAKALEYLTEAGTSSGPFAKLSAFQLGRLHVRRNDPESALAAYIEASSSDDAALQEESIYQAAKLNAKLGRFSAAISYAQDYQEAFPQGVWLTDINDLLAQSYLKTSDFNKAILLLEASSFDNSIQQEVYQKVTFQKAVLDFNDGNFEQAGVGFEKSLRFPISSTVANSSHFYLGEIYLRKERFSNAINSYNRMNPKNPQANYGLGYAYFNQQQYSEAIPFFRGAIEAEKWDIKQDARLRLADCLYATKSYEEASRLYRRLEQSDYVVFQQGMIARNQSDYAGALQFLSEISNPSSFEDDALFYQGLIAFENADFELSVTRFSQLIEGMSDSPYLPKAYLNRGLSSSNRGSYEAAKNDFDYVITNFLRKEEALSAILGLQDLQQKGIAIENLEETIRAYREANPDDRSLETVEFETAKSAYFGQEYGRAIRSITSFVQAYPKSNYGPEASYYLGDAYFRIDSLSAARDVFRNQRFLRTDFTGRVLFRLGSINHDLGDFDQAIESYKQLLELNLTPKDNFNAKNGLMLTWYAKDNYLETIVYADMILGSEWKPIFAEPQANLLKAKCFLALERTTEGEALLSQLAEGTDLVAVEAAYLDARLAYDIGSYDISLEKLFGLTSTFGTYTLWVEKAYLLIAENYIAKDELFQAKATLRSIVQHSQDQNTVNNAMTRLETIEQDLATDSVKVKNDE